MKLLHLKIAQVVCLKGNLVLVIGHSCTSFYHNLRDISQQAEMKGCYDSDLEV